WWQKLWGKKEHHEQADSLKEMEAVGEFLEGVNEDAARLNQKLAKLEELEKERQVAAEGVLHLNLQAQAAELDKMLEEYEFFQNDVDINGLRMRKIANNFLKEAEKAGMKDLVKEKKKDHRWQFWW
ncbi:MAG: hypothetical protein AABY26_00655, partial [Nanoarchaeota archaeon]